MLFAGASCSLHQALRVVLLSLFRQRRGGVFFGDRWGYVEGLLSWSNGVLDNSIYPGLFLAYVGFILLHSKGLITLGKFMTLWGWLFVFSIGAVISMA